MPLMRVLRARSWVGSGFDSDFCDSVFGFGFGFGFGFAVGFGFVLGLRAGGRSCRFAISTKTSTALRYAQQDSAHSGQGPVWIWQRRFLAWKRREWWGCGIGAVPELVELAGGVRKGLEGDDEDGDGVGEGEDGGEGEEDKGNVEGVLRSGEGRAGW